MPKKLCNQIGCSNIINYEDRYCVAHIQDNTKAISTKYYDDTKRDKARNQFYHSAQWKKLRTIQLKQEPLCTICHSVGEIADHITEIKDGGCATCLDNLQTLCQVCHNTKTARALSSRNR